MPFIRRESLSGKWKDLVREGDSAFRPGAEFIWWPVAENVVSNLTDLNPGQWPH